MRLEFHPAAAAELKAAIRNGMKFDHRVGVGLRDQTYRLAQLLVKTPALGTELSPQLRRLHLKDYPFSIIYRLKGESIQVIAFAHKRRKPGYWLSHK